MFERCLYFNANALARKLNARWDKAFARFHLAPSHGYLVRLVLEKPGLSQQAIADELRLEKSTIARFVSVLEGKKLVERRYAETSLRDKAIFPTAAAVVIQQDLEALGDELYTAMKAVIGPDKVKTLVASMREVASKI